VVRAALYIRTDPEGGLPSPDEQRAAGTAYAAEHGQEIVARYQDLEASGRLLYHKPGLKEAINNIKEEEDWEVLIVADPRCISEDASALHELVHKFSLYGNRLEGPGHAWENLLAHMKAYRREMSRR
jgi:DNA invertase Pin-like site-specific DNA recombinase